MSVLNRIERLENSIKVSTTKKRMHFIDGIADGIEGDIIKVMTDNSGNKLNGWNWVDDDIVLGILIV